MLTLSVFKEKERNIMKKVKTEMNNSRNQYHSGGNEETMKKNQNYVFQEYRKNRQKAFQGKKKKLKENKLKRTKN